VGRALKELGIEMIPAYSPQARGRSERRFGTCQGRLPQEPRLAGITTVEEANRILRQRYIPEMNGKFGVPTGQPGHAIVPLHGQNLDRIFSVQTERVLGKDNTVQIGDRRWQIERTPWGGTLAGYRVAICEHLDGSVSIVYGLQVVGRYRADGTALHAVGRITRTRSRRLARAALPLTSVALRAPSASGKEKPNLDRLCALKTGHLHVLRTGELLDGYCSKHGHHRNGLRTLRRIWPVSEGMKL
jgi:hypothetical protein